MILNDWNVSNADSIFPVGAFIGGAVKSVRIVKLASNHVLVAMIRPDQSLQMMAFQMNPPGGFIFIGGDIAGTVSSVDMATFGQPNKRAVTAVRQEANGKLRLVIWDINVDVFGNVSHVRIGARTAV